MAGRKRTDRLSDADRAAWDHVRHSVRPMHTAPPEPLPEPIPAPPRLPPVPPAASRAPARTGAQAAAPVAPRPVRPQLDLARDPMAVLAEAPSALDGRTATRLRQGKIAPQARLDLHGMYLEEAHGAALDFVRRCHGQGLRLVMIITGKGRSGPDQPGPMPQRRGLLRHALPQWLSVPGIAPLIVQILPAHDRHGGGGAYYIYLRRSR